MSESNRHERLLQELRQEYEARFPLSRTAHTQSERWLVDGGSHGVRLFEPYPFHITAAAGATVTDLDGHEILDFWQGHYANILGHNPEPIRNELVATLTSGYGLLTGLPEDFEAEYAQALATAVGAERVRLTTAGTLATMYAIMLARAHTRRRLVLKLSGGWHGANPMALKGVSHTASGFDQVDSAGVPVSTGDEIIVTPLNDVESLRKIFRAVGDRIACFIFEPCMGAAGFTPASGEFMCTARELTERYGALLILDEVITGFRYAASGVQSLYDVTPDLSTFGKIIGGGMPISAVLGRGEVMGLAGKETPERVWFNGGTFSAHTLCLQAGLTMIRYLKAHQEELYPRLRALGERMRTGIERVFADRGVLAKCTGHGNDRVPGSSLFTVSFPTRDDVFPASAEDLSDSRLTHVALREQAFKLSLLLHGVNVVHGGGALSYSHSEADLEQVFEACDAFALRLKRI